LVEEKKRSLVIKEGCQRGTSRKIGLATTEGENRLGNKAPETFSRQTKNNTRNHLTPPKLTPQTGGTELARKKNLFFFFLNNTGYSPQGFESLGKDHIFQRRGGTWRAAWESEKRITRCSPQKRTVTRGEAQLVGGPSFD